MFLDHTEVGAQVAEKIPFSNIVASTGLLSEDLKSLFQQLTSVGIDDSVCLSAAFAFMCLKFLKT